MGNSEMGTSVPPTTAFLIVFTYLFITVSLGKVALVIWWRGIEGIRREREASVTESACAYSESTYTAASVWCFENSLSTVHYCRISHEPLKYHRTRTHQLENVKRGHETKLNHTFPYRGLSVQPCSISFGLVAVQKSADVCLSHGV